jgi:hypothetical protein
MWQRPQAGAPFIEMSVSFSSSMASSHLSLVRRVRSNDQEEGKCDATQDVRFFNDFRRRSRLARE